MFLDASNPTSYPGFDTWYDLTASDNNVTLINAPTYSSSNGGYLQFNGSDQYGVFSNAASFPTGNEMSLGFWSYGTTPQASNIFSAMDGSNQRNINVHLVWTDSQVYWDCGNSGGSFDRIYTYLGTTYEGWHYWLFTKNAATGIMNIYRDGVLILQGSGQYNQITATSAARIAEQVPTNTVYWNGYMAQVQAYNRELSAGEVVTNYNTYATRFGLSPI